MWSGSILKDISSLHREKNYIPYQVARILELINKLYLILFLIREKCFHDKSITFFLLQTLHKYPINITFIVLMGELFLKKLGKYMNFSITIFFSKVNSTLISQAWALLPLRPELKTSCQLFVYFRFGYEQKADFRYKQTVKNLSWHISSPFIFFFQFHYFFKTQNSSTPHFYELIIILKYFLW